MLLPFVLRLATSRLEGLEREHVGAVLEGERVRGPAGVLDARALRLERRAQLVARSLEQVGARGERRALVQRRGQRPRLGGAGLLRPQRRPPPGGAPPGGKPGAPSGRGAPRSLAARPPPP